MYAQGTQLCRRGCKQGGSSWLANQPGASAALAMRGQAGAEAGQRDAQVPGGGSRWSRSKHLLRFHPAAQRGARRAPREAGSRQSMRGVVGETARCRERAGVHALGWVGRRGGGRHSPIGGSAAAAAAGGPLRPMAGGFEGSSPAADGAGWARRRRGLAPPRPAPSAHCAWRSLRMALTVHGAHCAWAWAPARRW